MKKSIALFGMLTVVGVSTAEISGFIGGLEPASRPAGAPVITHFEQTPVWQAQALRGIGQPHVGLDFLKDQGAWYTPFIYPNLLGRYDIRGLHADAVRKD